LESQIGGADDIGYNKSIDLKKKIILLYKNLANSYFNFDYESEKNLKFQIEKIEIELQKDEYQIFFNNDIKKYVSFAEFIKENEEKNKKLLFNIQESTGTGNYKLVELWNISEIYNYLIFKNQQIKNLQQKNNGAK
jgi:hypothetical protein